MLQDDAWEVETSTGRPRSDTPAAGGPSCENLGPTLGYHGGLVKYNNKANNIRCD